MIQVTWPLLRPDMPKRGEKTGDAMTQFPAADQDSSKQLEQLMSSATQMPQQFMQAFGGMFQGLSQGMNQAMQQGMQMGTQMAGSLGKAGQGAGMAGELPAEALGDALGAGGAALGASGAAGGAGAGLADATIPAGNLGPPPVPSAGTTRQRRNRSPAAQFTRSVRGNAGVDGRRHADDAAWCCGRRRCGRQRQ